MKLFKFLYLFTALTVQGEIEAKSICIDYVSVTEQSNGKTREVDSQFCHKVSNNKCEIVEFGNDGIVSNVKKAKCSNFFPVWGRFTLSVGELWLITR